MAKKLIEFIKFWFPVFVYSGIIFCVSSLPSSRLPTPIGYDKILHLVEYIPFGFLLAWALRNTNYGLSGNTLISLVLLFSLLYGVSDEYHQSFVPGRDSNWVDVVADSIGGVIGGLIYFRLKRERRAK